MDQLIDQISERLIKQLPEDNSYYYPQDFLNSHFPPFLVDRIILELKRNLEETIDPPETDWADMSSESVQKAWSSFIEAVRADVRMPSGYGTTVVNNAVSDVVELLLEPRKFIPEYLFGDKEYLSYEEVAERTQWLVVYPYFQRALLRYMEKKEIDELSKSRGEQITERIDEKLTQNFDENQWGELLEPWFELIGREIDSDLFRSFFEDKSMPELAERFDQADESLSRKKLIATISGQEVEDTADDGQGETLTGAQEEQSEPESAPLQDEADDEAQSIIDQFESVKPEDESAEAIEAEEDNETDISRENEYFSEEPEEEQEKESEDTLLNQSYRDEDESDEESPLYQQTMDEEEEEVEDSDVDSEEVTDRNEEQTSWREDYDTEEEAEQDSEVETDAEEDGSSEEIPMWQRFAGGNEEDEEELPFFTSDDEEEEESPIIDFSAEEPSETEEYRRLMREISDVRDYFVDELFSGDESAFERAMEHLVTFNTWSEAVKFISQEIFRRNMIDMYSDVAVEFTDRMQTFFLQKPNKED